MARPKKITTTNDDGTIALTPVQRAQETLAAEHRAFVKSPTAANYNAFMYAARSYQNAFRAQFSDEVESK